MLTPYERHLTRQALATPSTPRGPIARMRAEDAGRERKLAELQRDLERSELVRIGSLADALAQRTAGGRG